MAPFIVGAIIIHLLILFLAFIYQTVIFEDKKAKKEERKPDFIEITELIVPKEKETPPPEEPKRLAERSHKAQEEKSKDDWTKRSAAVPRQPKPAPGQKAKPKPLKKEIKKAEDKRKKAQRQASKTDLPVDKQLASLPKDKPKDEVQESLVPKIQTQKDNYEIVEEVPFSASRNTPTRDPQRQQDLMGSRDVEKKEETVDLSTTEFKYLSYFIKLKRQIEGVWNYPEESRIRGEQGKLFLVFSINRDGTLAGVELLTSSGYARLDDEAMRSIRVASPFPPFPKSWDGLERLNVRATFEYGYGRIF